MAYSDSDPNHPMNQEGTNNKLPDGFEFKEDRKKKKKKKVPPVQHAAGGKKMKMASYYSGGGTVFTGR